MYILYLLLIFFCGYGIAQSKTKYDKLYFICTLIGVIIIRYYSTRGV